MKYNNDDVLDIIKSISDKDPQEVLLNWNINKSNTHLSEEDKERFNNFVYTFPLIVDNEEVASITIVDLYNDNEQEQDLMQKYFGHNDYDKSLREYSYDTYLMCYLIINKEFKLPEISKGFHGGSFIGKDAKGVEFKFDVVYGYPESESDLRQFDGYVNSRSYRFYNDVTITVDKILNGWNLSEAITNNINNRVIN